MELGNQEIIMEGNGREEAEPDPELIFDEELTNVFTTETQEEGETIEEAGHVVELEIESEPVVESTVDEVAAAQAQAEADAVASINIQMDGVDVDMDITEETISAHEFLISTDGTFFPQTAELEVELSPEDQLKSTEKLDRSSPDLWPTNLPTTAKQLLYNNQVNTGENDMSGSWAQGLDPEDINLLHQFGSLTSSSLVEEVRKLQNIAHQLGLDEKKEMTRGKLLRVLGGPHNGLKETDSAKRRWN